MVNVAERAVQCGGDPFNERVAGGMAEGIVDGLEVVNIHDDEREGRIALLVGVQSPLKMPPVQQIRQRVVLGLPADHSLGLLTFLAGGVVGRDHLPQLHGPLHRQRFSAPDVFYVAGDRPYKQPKDEPPTEKDDQQQKDRAVLHALQGELEVFGGKRLLLLGFRNQNIPVLCNVLIDEILAVFIFVIAEEPLGPCDHLIFGQRGIRLRKLDVQQLLRPVGGIVVRGLQHEPHRVKFHMHQILRVVHGGENVL